MRIPSSTRRGLIVWSLTLPFGRPATPHASNEPRGSDADAPRTQTLALVDATIELQVEPTIAAALDEPIAQAVRRAAAAVRGYFDRFPMASLEIEFQAAAGTGVISGATFAEPAPWIRVRLGTASGAAVFADDWVLVHEMVHLALPRVPRTQRWLHEGVATYVEALARSRAGWIAPASVWQAWVRDMAQGEPEAGDQGLDHTPTWGRTYWGGALFCLLADLALLRATQGRSGLRQGLQRLLASGADYRQVADAAQLLAIIDEALGTRVLGALYAEHAARAVVTDLPALWRELGVRADGLDDAAPLAALRRAILG